MLTSRHPHDRDLLMSLDDELPSRQDAAVDEHVSACPACRTRLHRIQTTLADAGSFYDSAFGPAEPRFPSSRLRLERALHEAAAEWNDSWLTRLRCVLTAPPARAGVGLALTVVLLVVLWISKPGGIVDGSPPVSGASLPIATLTPGAVSTLTAAELCTGARPSRLVTDDSRDRVLRDYRMQNVSARTYELDALITPELGGTTAPENLWPQRYESPVWNARVKDELETLLPKLVCSNQVDLAVAQREIARDWVAAYKRYFRTDVPLQAHRGAPTADDDDLHFAPVRYVAENAAPMAVALRFARQ